ncbi:MAG: hypothetical protein A4E55_00017 [Pelotomaculum sp. PtaU1.Bin035]|nr:MAG: hypothetical protein A4E55_00017 [Pelotomaculum sp. PtaU1.Bin035]
MGLANIKERARPFESDMQAGISAWLRHNAIQAPTQLTNWGKVAMAGVKLLIGGDHSMIREGLEAMPGSRK